MCIGTHERVLAEINVIKMIGLKYCTCSDNKALIMELTNSIKNDGSKQAK